MFKEPPRELIDRLPALKKVRRILPENRIIHLHFFFQNCHWYIAAWVEDVDGDTVFFGFVNLDDPVMAEWGDFTLSQLRELRKFTNVWDAHTFRHIGILPVVVEWDEYWKPRPFGDINWRNAP